MRQLLPVFSVFALIGCGDPASETLKTETVSLALRADGATLAVFNTILRSENEPNNTSTSESLGLAQVKVLGDGTINFTLVINNRADETYVAAHIHKAPAGEPGDVHWDFLQSRNPVPSISGQPAKLRGTARARAAADLEDLLSNPEGYYVNVHSTVFPGGAIRGQLQ
jgi:hypothetical protein